MRFYSIRITDPTTGQLWTPPSIPAGLLGGSSYASFIKGTSILPAASGGRTLPAAWDVEIDIPSIGSATPQGFALVTIWGISVQEVSQAQSLTGKNMEISVGFKKGLPLANPTQSGVVFSGMIFQCFANWIGTNMTLDFIVVPGVATASQPGGLGFLEKERNFTLSWQGGQKLSDALTTTLKTAGFTPVINISDNLVSRKKDEQTAPYSTLNQLASVVRQISIDIIDPNHTTGYQGVTMVPRNDGKTIDVFDTPQGNPVDIAFEDLIGQPTWIETPMIQFKTAMRGDLKPGQPVNLPKNNVTINTAAAFSNIANQRVTFQGGFVIRSLRHVGVYRQPSADAWVTVIEAYPIKPVQQSGNVFNPGSPSFTGN